MSWVGAWCAWQSFPYWQVTNDSSSDSQAEGVNRERGSRKLDRRNGSKEVSGRRGSAWQSGPSRALPARLTRVGKELVRGTVTGCGQGTVEPGSGVLEALAASGRP